MQTATQKFWEVRLQDCKAALEKYNFEAFIAQTPANAARIVLDQILPQLDVKSVSWGDSLTLQETGILEFFEEDPTFELIETFDENLLRAEIIDRRRKALLSDLFFSGTNKKHPASRLPNLGL